MFSPTEGRDFVCLTTLSDLVFPDLFITASLRSMYLKHARGMYETCTICHLHASCMLQIQSVLEPAVHGRGAEGNCFVNSDRLEVFELSFMNPYKECLKSVGGKVKFLIAK